MKHPIVRLNTKLILGIAICGSAAFSGKPLLGQNVASQDNEALLMEKGKSVVGNVCVACHTNILRVVQVHKESPAQWKDTVYSMIGRGAQVMPDEIDAVTLFLSANAGNHRLGQASTENAASRGKQDRPTEADGRGILERSCQQCHDLATASARPAGADWTAVIAKMVNYGARLSPADKQQIIDYLNSLDK